jgi:hypothetical protein
MANAPQQSCYNDVTHSPSATNILSPLILLMFPP